MITMVVVDPTTTRPRPRRPEYTFGLANLKKYFPLEPLVHLELIRMTYGSSPRKGSFCSNKSSNMDARYYLGCWLTKCEQNFQMWRHYINTEQALQELFYRNKRTKSMFLIVLFLFIVCNAIFNNISVMSWWSVLLVEETPAPVGNHRSVASNWRTLSHNVVSSTPRHERVSNSQH
jgi:hypothetical protein